MEEIQNVRKLLPCRIAVATVTVVAAVAGLGVAPAGADELKGEAETRVEVKEKGATTLMTVAVKANPGD